MIKAIVFDFGGVFNTAAHFDIIYPILAKRIGVSFDEAREIVKEEWTLCKLGKISCDQFYEHLGYEFGIENFRSFWFKSFKYISGMPELVAKLKGKYKLFIFSNAIKDWFENQIKELNLDYFDGFVLSYEEGMDKPEIKFYNLLEEKYNLLSNEILFVDDKLYNLKPAKDLGWDVIHFQSVKQLKEEFEKRSIL